MRKILIGLAVLVVLAVVAVVAAPFLLDAEAQKPRIQALVEQATGRRLSIDGGLSFALLPSPSIDAENVTIAGLDEAGPPLMTLKRLSLRLALSSLFRGVVEITEVRLDSPVVTLGPAPAAAGGDQAVAPTPPAPSSGGGFDVAVRNAVIENGSVVIPGADGAETRIDGIEAQLSAEGLKGPFKLSGGATTAGLPVTLDMAVGRLDGGQFPLDLTVALAGAAARLNGLAGLSGDGPQRFKGKLHLGVEDPAALAALTGLAPPPGQQFSLDGNVVFDGGKVAVDDLSLTAGEARGTGTLRLETGDKPTGMLTLRVPRLVLQGPAAAAPTAAAEPAPAAAKPAPFALPGGVTFTVDLAVDVLQINGGVVQKVAVIGALDDGVVTLSAASAQLPGATDVAVSGTLSGGPAGAQFTGRFDVAADNLRALMDWLKVSPAGVPADRLTRLALTGKVDGGTAGVALSELKGRLDGMNMSGSIRYAAGPPADVGLDLAFDRLDLDAYLATGPAAAAPKAGASPAMGAPAGNLHVAAKVKIGGLRYQGIDLKSVVVDGALGGSTITINQASVADMAGASLSAKGVVGLAKGAADADLRLTATAPSVAPLAALAGVAVPLDPGRLGAVTVDLGLKGSAEAPRLDGTIGLGGTRITVAGTTGALSGTPKLDLAGKITAPDLVGLGQQLGLDGQGAAGPVDLSYTLKGPPEALAATVTGPLGPLAAILAFEGSAGGWHTTAKLQGDKGAVALTRLGLVGPVDGPLSLDLEAAKKGDVITLGKAAIRFGPTAVQASGTLGKGRFDGAVTADTIDMALFGGAAGATAKTPEAHAAAPAERWSSAPFDLTALRQIDGSLTLKLGRLVNGALAITDLNAKVTAIGGKLSLSGLTGGLNPGALRGSLTLDGAGQELGVVADLTLAGADLDAVTGRAPTGMGLSGLGDVTIDLTGRGKSQLALVSSLAGTIAVTAQSGKIHGLDLKRLSEGLKTVNQPGDLINRALVSVLGGTTDYRRLAATISVAKGVATVSRFESDVDGGTFDLAGGADLPAWSIRARGAVKLNEPRDMPPLGVLLSGPLDAPRTDLDSAAVERYYLARFLGKQVPGLGNILGFPGMAPADSGTAPGAPAPQAAPPAAPSGNAAPADDAAPAEQPAKPRKPRKSVLDGLLKGLGN